MVKRNTLFPLMHTGKIQFAGYYAALENPEKVMDLLYLP